MTDANAQVLWWRDQTPFGQTVTAGGFSETPLRFPGQFADAESGLAYNYFRDYDPALGRYIQSDPIGLGGGLNTYGYVMGNPLRYTDPTGEYGLPGAGYGAISGGIGGYIFGGVEGAVIGAVVGAGVGYFAPALSKSAGSAAATNAAISAATSVVGQFFGNLVAGKDLADRCNWSLGAVVGAAAGGRQ